MNTGAPRVAVVVPCFNEEATIAAVLAEIASCGQGYAPIVVDDGSNDATYKIASRTAPTVRLLRNMGIGTAVQTGIKYAEAHGFDFCVQLDGDGQHPPSEIAKLLEAYARQPRAIIVGSRYLQNDTFRSTWARRVGNRAIAQALGLLFARCEVSDPTSGMRLMDRTAMRLFAQRYPHDFPEPISLAWALKNGLAIGETAVHMRSRTRGRSSISGLKIISYMLRVLSYIALARFSRFGSY